MEENLTKTEAGAYVGSYEGIAAKKIPSTRGRGDFIIDDVAFSLLAAATLSTEVVTGLLIVVAVWRPKAVHHATEANSSR